MRLAKLEESRLWVIGCKRSSKPASRSSPTHVRRQRSRSATAVCGAEFSNEEKLLSSCDATDARYE
eukprot:scaffold221472_cov27-Tisochrysis_lutea.AAC.2